jgi:hypothetical protein
MKNNVVMKYILLSFSFALCFFNHNLYAGTCSNDFIENRKPTLPFVPFPMKDPETGKSLLPNDIITLQDKNNKSYQVKAIDFFNQINSLEYSLNLWGYSLRDPDGSYNLSSLDMCSKLLDQQKDAIQKAFITDPANKMSTYEEWKKNIENIYNVYKSAIPSFDDLSRYGDNSKFDDFITTVQAFDVPRAIIKKPQLRSFQKEKNWSFEKGQKSKFYIAGNAGYKISAGTSGVFSDARAGLNGAVLGVWDGSIADANAIANAPSAENGKLSVTANVFGKTLFASNQDLGKLGYKDEKTLFDTPVNYETSVRFAIGPIPVRLAAGIRGNNVMKWGIEIVPLELQTYLHHYAGIDAYASAAVDIYVAGAGVTGRLLLIAVNTQVSASAYVDFTDQPSLKLQLVGTTELDALNGDLRVYVYAYLPTWKFWKRFLERKEWSTTLASFSGYQLKGNIFDYSATLTPTGFSAKGDLSVDDVSEELDINKGLKREDKILSLENKTQEKLNETFNAIVTDLKSDSNLNILKDEVIYSEAEKSMDNAMNDFALELGKWTGQNI